MHYLPVHHFIFTALEMKKKTCLCDQTFKIQVHLWSRTPLCEIRICFFLFFHLICWTKGVSCSCLRQSVHSGFWSVLRCRRKQLLLLIMTAPCCALTPGGLLLSSLAVCLLCGCMSLLALVTENWSVAGEIRRWRKKHWGSSFTVEQHKTSEGF